MVACRILPNMNSHGRFTTKKILCILYVSLERHSLFLMVQRFGVFIFDNFTNVDYLPKSQSCYWLWLLLKEGGTGADGKMTTEIPTQIWAWVSVAQVAIWTSKILTGCHGDWSLQCQKGPEKSPASEARTQIFIFKIFLWLSVLTKSDHSFYRFVFKHDAATLLYIIFLNKATVSDSF